MGLIERRLSMRFSKIPGEDPSQIAFSPKIGNLHRVIIGKLRRVTICRELMHADQIVESVVTDRVTFWQCLVVATDLRSRYGSAREPTGLLGLGSSPSGGHSLLARYPETLTSPTQTYPPVEPGARRRDGDNGAVSPSAVN
jgi:hypothetical protein